MKEKTQDNVIEEALNQIVQNQVCLSLSEIRLIDQKVLDNIIFKKVKVGQGDQSESQQDGYEENKDENPEPYSYIQIKCKKYKMMGEENCLV